ncbi:MAG: tetratricopeptide repeat protein, partial [Candidatus Competibacter sp.]
MDQYTDDERVEDLKNWWKENGASIIVGIGLGVIAIFGWQYWNSYRHGKAEQASQAYDAFIEAVEKPDADQARQRGQALLNNFPKSPYTTLAALRLAKLAADSGDAPAAIKQLEGVIETAQLDELKDIARLRLARVLFGAGRPADAEQALNQIKTA